MSVNIYHEQQQQQQQQNAIKFQFVSKILLPENDLDDKSL